MALTGELAANGRSALLAQKVWEEDTNAKGGLLGRPVKLIYHDDQTNPASVPGIYAKLLDVDKVDLIIGPYGVAAVGDRGAGGGSKVASTGCACRLGLRQSRRCLRLTRNSFVASATNVTLTGRAIDGA